MLFGETRIGTAPFGSKVWNGIRELAVRDAALRHYPLENIQLGWFQAPQPFSKVNAQLPLERIQWLLIAYPAVFVKLNGELWIVRCVATLLNNGKNWYTHWSRVTLITTEDDVIPPPFRLCLLAACSAIAVALLSLPRIRHRGVRHRAHLLLGHFLR